MARATRASGERNPKAMRVSIRSLVFTLSTFPTQRQRHSDEGIAPVDAPMRRAE